MFGYLNLLNSELIGSSEATEAVNCDISDGILKYRKFDVAGNYLKEARIFGLTYRLAAGIVKRGEDKAGMLPPPASPVLTSVDGGKLNGVYRYCYTVADEFIESPPSPIVEISVQDSSVKLSGFKFFDSKAKRIRIYRQSPGSEAFLLVADIPASESEYIDELSDDQLGEACDSWDNYPPPIGGSYITSLHDKLFLAYKNRVYFSRTGIPEAWPKDFFFKFDSDVTGFATVNETLLIFTENRIYALYGHDETDFVLKVSNSIVGAIHNSVQDIGSRALFVAKDGIYLTNGVDAVKVSEKIEPLFPINPTKSSFDGRFYSVKSDKGTIVYDTLLKGFLTADDKERFIWKSKDFTSKYPLWQLRNIIVDLEGSVTVEVFRDGQLMSTLKIKHDKRKEKVYYIKGLRGNRFSFRFTGDKNAKLYGYRFVRAT